jgi:hypothetical protein
MASDGDFPRVESLTYAFVALDPDHDDFSQTKPGAVHARGLRLPPRGKRLDRQERKQGVQSLGEYPRRWPDALSGRKAHPFLEVHRGPWNAND